MGGGTSRLDDTDWEHQADGCLLDEHQTVDGERPTSCYQLYEIQKRSVGQRAFDVVDAQHNVLLTTQAVTGTLSWFDVLGPKSIGDFYKDYKLRVQATDTSRRTWIVYRYHVPVFEGQKPAHPQDVMLDPADTDTKLYKTACITVSWSRYVAVAARYGPPQVQDFLNLELEEEDNDYYDVDYDDESDGHQRDFSEVASKNHEGVNVSTPTRAKKNSFGRSDDDPLFSVAKQIAARSRERANTGSSSIEANYVDQEKSSRQDLGTNDETQNKDNFEDERKSDQDPAINSTKEKVDNDPTPVRTKTEKERKETSQTLDILHDSPDTKTDAIGLHQSNHQPEEIATDIRTVVSNDLTVSPASSSVATNPSPSKRRDRTTSNVKRPATTLTELAASQSFRKSTSSHRPSIRTQTIRDFLAGKTTTANNNNRGPSKFGSRFLERSTSNQKITEENNDGSDAASTKSFVKKDGPTTKELYELALEGVIDLDTQPIVQCQEIYNKMLGNHQTFNMTKEQLFQLLKLDVEQHETPMDHQAQQETDGEMGTFKEGDDPNVKGTIHPMVQAMELDAKHQIQKETKNASSYTQSTRSSARWMPNLRNAVFGGTDDGGTTITDKATAIETINIVQDNMKCNASDVASPSNDSSNSSGRRLRSSWNRMFSVKSVHSNNPHPQSQGTKDMVHLVEKSLAAAAPVSTTTTALDLNRDSMPSLLDDTNSGSLHSDTLPTPATSATSETEGSGIEQIHTQQEESEACDTIEFPLSPSPGDGVEETKVEAVDTPPIKDHRVTQNGSTNNNRNDIESVSQTSTVETTGQGVHTESNLEDDKPMSNQQVVDDHPNPLVGYWFWKHTTLNFGQHKMYMHLAKNSDLSLHVIFAIIVNQVRSERNHTIFATTGLHPAWFFIDPKNPKAMIN